MKSGLEDTGSLFLGTLLWRRGNTPNSGPGTKSDHILELGGTHTCLCVCVCVCTRVHLHLRLCVAVGEKGDKVREIQRRRVEGSAFGGERVCLLIGWRQFS